MALDLLAAGLLLGLSSGIQCSVACLPLLLTQLTRGRATPREGIRMAFLFSLGRLLVYLVVSFLLFFFLGAFGSALRNPLSESLSTALLGIIMVYYCYRSLFGKKAAECAAGLQRKPFGIPLTSFAVATRPGRDGTSLLLGIVSSMNVCLPLIALISISAFSNLYVTFAAVSMFWVGSSVYAMGLSVVMAGASRIRIGTSVRKRVGFIGSLSGLMFGAFLLLAGLSSLSLL
jgi:hypothetical protein